MAAVHCPLNAFEHSGEKGARSGVGAPITSTANGRLTPNTSLCDYGHQNRVARCASKPAGGQAGSWGKIGCS
jgi:hypothetical protein